MLTAVHVHLEHAVAKGFRCQRAADSLDIDTKKKSVHDLRVEVDLATPYTLGLIVGASGSGKTTLARQMFGDVHVAETILDPAKTVLDQFPEDWSYDACAAALAGMGLTSVPCWIRPVTTLSNGQRVRAGAALRLALAEPETPVVLDEWTSVVDRTVAKVMSHCVQKFARRGKTPLVLLSCHYDVIDWLNPDWIIDCNRQTYIDRRALWPEFKRKETLRFDVAPVDRKTWAGFQQYHYLSARLPGGSIYTYGLFHGGDQIGFQCFANYTPTRPGKVPIYHSNRTVIHPDYAGMGLGMKLINVTSQHMVETTGFRVMAKFTSTPIYRAMRKDPRWRFIQASRNIGLTQVGGRINRRSSNASHGGFRENVKAYHFEFLPERSAA